MHKKQFIALADAIRTFNSTAGRPFSRDQLSALADFCQEQNPKFNRVRWLCYVQGACGPNGGNK